MVSWADFEVWRRRREELIREAQERALAREARRVRQAFAAVEERPVGMVVRWGLAEDEEKIADLLQLNGMPRWVAFEERFIVAERDGRILGALRYATASKKLSLGLLVVDPWSGERRIAKALYAGARGLAREMGVAEIGAARTRGRDYPAAAGYRRAGRGWRSPADGSDAGAPDGWRARFASWVAEIMPVRRDTHGQECES